MNMDALTAIENFASSIFSAGMDFLFTWGEFIGVISMITLFARARSAGPVKMSPGKFIAGMLTSCMLVSLPAMINAGGVQMGFRADSFGPIAYVPKTKQRTFPDSGRAEKERIQRSDDGNIAIFFGQCF